MAFWTVANYKAKLNRDIDLEEEVFVQDAEFLEYINDAQREVAAALLKLNHMDNYYLTTSALSLVQGTQDYQLPSNIYANKIVAIIYDNGVKIYRIKRPKGKELFELIHEANKYATGYDEYKYIIMNASAATGYRLRLVPKAQETSASNVTIWYVREPDRVTLTTDNIDVPEEFIQYVFDYVKAKCLGKEVGNPLLASALADKEASMKSMVDTLTDQAHDGDNTLSLDLDHYSEST